MLKIRKSPLRVRYASLVASLLFLVVGSFFVISGRTAHAFEGGDGSSGAPYQISDCNELQDISANLSANYVLTSNIDCSDTATQGFTPIGDSSTPFTGSLDGKNFTISNLTINTPDATSYVGLFGMIQLATVQNIYFTGANMTGAGNVGTLAGYMYGTDVTNVSVTSSTVSTNGNQNAGGIFGIMYRSGLTNSDFQGTVQQSSGTTAGYLGGITGTMVESSMQSVRATANVTGDQMVGGLTGGFQGDSILDSYATGSAQGSDFVGGLIGDINTNDDTDIENSYANVSVDASGIGASAGGLFGRVEMDGGGSTPTFLNDFAVGSVAGAVTGGVTGDFTQNGSTPDFSSDWFDQITTNQTACDNSAVTTCNTTSDGNTSHYQDPANDPLTSWDFTNFWTIPISGGLPVLQSESHADPVITFAGGTGTTGDPYQINTCLMLEGMQQYLSSSFELTANIDCSDTVNWNAGEGFQPVGDGNGAFTGTFDGNGFTISNISSIRADDDSTTTNSSDPADNQDYIGLFGNTNDATLTNIHITHSKMKGYQYVGGIVGYMTGGTLSDSSFNIGTVDNDCTASVADGGQCAWARFGLDGGGLVGYMDGGTITYSQTAGPVKGSGNIIGGLVGYMTDSASVSDSSSSSNVNGGSDIGGAVGDMENGSSMSRVAVTGDVYSTLDNEVNKPGYFAGGFAGIMNNSTVSDSSATGSVHSDVSNAGGFSGQVNGSTINDSYATGDVDTGNSSDGGQGYDAGGFIGAIVESTFARDYASGTVSALGMNAGGFTGYVYNDTGSISDSFATGTVSAPSTTGGFIGTGPDVGTLSNDYYDSAGTGQSQCVGDVADPVTGCTGVNADEIQNTYFTDSTNTPFTQAGTQVWDPSTWYFSGTDLPIHVTDLSGPHLNLPTTNQVVKNLHIDVDIPQTPLTGSSSITLVGPTTITLHLSDLGVGDHVFDINASNILSSPHVQSVSPSVTTIPNGVYTVVYAYQPANGSPAVSDSVSSVDITSVAQILCYQPTSTYTTATVYCVTSPDEYGTTTWQMRYAVHGSTTYTTVTLPDNTIGQGTITGLTPGTNYDIQLHPSNSYTGVYGVDGWGTVQDLTAGTAPTTPSDTTAASAPTTTPSSATKTNQSSSSDATPDATGVTIESPTAIAAATSSAVSLHPSATNALAKASSTAHKTTSTNWWWLLLVIIIVLLLVIFLIVRRRRRANN